MTSATPDLAARAETFRGLHRGAMLVLPNAWDAGSAAVVAAAGGRAVATASAAVSAVLGYPDGEVAPWREMFAAAGRIVRAVVVPVTVDAEAGYGLPPRDLVDALLEIGAVGCNLEDTDHRAGGLQEAGAHANWLSEVRAAADVAGVPLVINARIDTFLPPSGVPDEARVAETARRGELYRQAGADCLYPIGVRRRADLVALVDVLPGPLNANVGDELDLPGLRGLGIARVSYGPRFYRTALADFGTAVRAVLG
jgi:2-methylisocitrate lyase-like PEP mutase family enzyme